MTSHMNAQPPATPIQILLAEDNPGDVFLIREALREQGLEYELSVVEDGEAAVSFVCREGAYAEAARPDLILLDLNLPKYGGREILRRVREIPELAHVPVAILSSSDWPKDRLDTAALGANCYIQKPFSLEEFMEIGAVLKELLSSTTLVPTTE